MGNDLGTFCLVRSPPLGRPLRADRELRAPASRHCLPRTLKVPPGWTPNIQRTQASHFLEPHRGLRAQSFQCNRCYKLQQGEKKEEISRPHRGGDCGAGFVRRGEVRQAEKPMEEGHSGKGCPDQGRPKNRGRGQLCGAGVSPLVVSTV